MLAHDFISNDDRNFRPASSTKSACYFVFLVAAKLFRCIGIFLTDVLSKSSHVVTLLWLYKLIVSCSLVPVQKPFAHGKSLRKPLLMRIARLALMNCVIEVAWLYGLTLCGPLRTVLVFEMSPSILVAGAAAVMKGGDSPAKSRGLICIVAGLVALLLMDRDETIADNHSSSHAHHAGLNHLFYHMVSVLGMTDHQGGVLLLLVTLLLRIGYDSSFRHLAVEIGGAKRLHSLVNLFSLAILTMPALLIIFIFSSQWLAPMGWWTYLGTGAASALAIFVLDFYAESICFQHVADPVMGVARWSPITMFSSALFLAWAWYSPGGVHPVTGGVIFTVIVFSLGCIWLTSSSGRKHKAGHLVGISDSGMPLYTYGEAFLQRTSRSLLLFAKDTLREILANADSRRIFWFLLVNLSFCGVEFLYGFWTNSLGLISDAFHMLFDCSALVMGLVASVMSRWPATKHYTYGYGRVEVLSGFINALFLNVIATFILMEAWGRIWDPPKVNTDRLLIVAVIGLCVNLFGMYSFHGSDDGHGHSHHGHSHGGGHGHSHGGGNANMQGVFLHVLADTLGSVFVIISSVLMDLLGWQWVDPFCSFILSLLILGSAYPLLKSSASNLLQDVPGDAVEEWEHHVHDILSVEGIVSYSDAHFWQLKSDLNVASIHVQVTPDAHVQTIRHKVVALLKAAGATQSSVQVEKEYYEHAMRQRQPNWAASPRTTRGSSISMERRNGHSHGGHGHSHDGGHGHSHDH